MAGIVGNRFLDNARINRIIQTLASELNIARPLIYISRLPIVNAFDDEIMGRFTGKVIAADIIADDQEAVVQEGLKVELTTTQIPNLKVGQRVGQAALSRMERLQRASIVEEENAMADWEQTIARNLLLGVRQRMNAIACAMMIDAFTYDRMGVQITGATWGMPANLKVTPATGWASTSSTPIADAFSMDAVAQDSYGMMFDTMTLSSLNFTQMTNTTEFANKAALVLGAGFLTASSALLTGDRTRMQALAGQILNKRIVIDDATYTERSNSGVPSTTRYLPQHKVLLSRSQDEGNGNVMDFANAIVTESIVASMMANGPEGLGGPQYGPIAYWTGRPDLNPPDIVGWGVARGWARKIVPEATAVLTVN